MPDGRKVIKFSDADHRDASPYLTELLGIGRDYFRRSYIHSRRSIPAVLFGRIECFKEGFSLLLAVF